MVYSAQPYTWPAVITEWASAAQRGVYQRQRGQIQDRESQASKGVEEPPWWGVGVFRVLRPGSLGCGRRCLDRRGFCRTVFHLGARETLDLAAVTRLSQQEESEG